SGNGVGLARKDVVVVGNVGIDELLNVLDSVRKVYVVVAGPVENGNVAVEIFRGIGNGVIAIDIGILRGQPQITLGIDRVVIAEIGDGSNGAPYQEAVGVAERIKGESASPTPAPPAQAMRIKLRI